MNEFQSSQKKKNYFNQIETLNSSIEQFRSSERKLTKEIAKLTDDIKIEREKISANKATIEEVANLISSKEEEYIKITEKFNEIALDKRKLKITYDSQIEVLEAGKIRLESLAQSNSRYSSTENIRITQIENEKTEIEAKLIHLTDRYSRLENQISEFGHIEKGI